MNNLTDQVLGQFDASRIEAIAAQLGVDPAQAQAAIQQAVPMVVGGLARNASADPGAVHAMAADHAGLDIGGLLGGLLGGGGAQAQGGLGGLGGAILGGLFGNRQDQATQGLGQATGIGSQNAGQLLAMLVPIVMSMLGKMNQGQQLDPGALGGALAQESQRVNQGAGGGLLGSMLDQDGDGQVGLSDLLKIGSEMFGSRGRV